ncbi:MAG: vWA domain-containing protein, partial [Actinomycetota bacterium]
MSLLKGQDMIGLVRFNDVSARPADVLLELTPGGDGSPGTGKAEAQAKLTPANLNPSGNTSIGAGILLGTDVLDSAAAQSRAIVVLTDGIQNTAPDIPEATAVVTAKTPRQRVFAVGLGLHQLEDKLHQIASVTGGVAQITGELVGYKEFLLQKLYVQILADVSDEAFVTDPREMVPPGGQSATDVYLGEVDVAADFIVAFRETRVFPKYMEVWLEAPDGTTLAPADVAGIPTGEFVRGRGHLYFRLAFPASPEGHIGRWRVWVRNLSGHHGEEDEETAVGMGREALYYS